MTEQIDIPMIPLPTEFSVEEQEKNRAVVTISPLFPGYGTTMGNALRRVLFSSLPGAAVTTVKIKDVPHEFSTIPHVAEDVVEIIMNLKQLRLTLHGDEPQTISLKAKGAKELTGKDLETPSQVEVASPDQHIATLTDAKAEISMEMTVTAGRGYIPVETREKEQREIGAIAIDALYTPVKTVTFRTENVRVEQMTNWDKLFLEIETDGTLSPEEAFTMATTILNEHFTQLGSLVRGEDVTPAAETVPDEEGDDEKPSEDREEEPKEPKGDTEGS